MFRKLLQRPSNRDDGFTLIELLVVVIIIGILAAIAIPIYLNQRSRGHEAQVVAQIRNVVTAIELSFADGDGGDLVGDPSTGTVAAGAGTPVPVATTDGVEWSVAGSARGYCISGWSVELGDYTQAEPLVYDSTVGKTLPDGLPCTPVPGTGGGPGGPGGPLPPGPGPDPDPDPTVGGSIAFTLDLSAPGCTDLTVRSPFRGTVDGTINWGDGTIEPMQGAAQTHTYAAPGEYTVTGTGEFSLLAFNGAPAACLISVDSWDGDTGTTSLANAFAGAVNLTAVATPPAGLTTLMRAFHNASSFNQDLSGWDVSTVTNMTGVFQNASSFNGDISGWNTGNVTSMQDMFYNASSFNQDLSGWDVGNVTHMNRFDQGAEAWEPHHKPSFG